MIVCRRRLVVTPRAKEPRTLPRGAAGCTTGPPTGSPGDSAEAGRSGAVPASPEHGGAERSHVSSAREAEHVEGEPGGGKQRRDADSQGCGYITG